MKYFKKITGEKCYLSPMSLDDSEKYTNWLNSIELGNFLGSSTQMVTLKREYSYIEDSLKKGDHIYAIIDLATDTLIGNTGLHEINHRDGTAVIGIFIGEKENWNKGYGTEAISMLLDYAFNILNLHNVMLNVFSYNERGIACYKKIGFKIIGRRREAKKIFGKRYDEVKMDILASDFHKNYIKNGFE